MDNRSDETLLDLYFAGDADAFKVFFERHAGRVVGYAMSKGLRQEIALEVRQDAFLRLHRSIHTYEKGRPALPWFFTIVHNCVIDALRQVKQLGNLRSQMIGERGTPGVVTGTDSLIDSTGTLASLSEEQRKVFEMRVFNELSFAEISVETGKTEVSLRKVFERARRKIQGILSGSD
ncbi:MAG TPA: RNA polymerase sigma factor [Oligoflexus sp.]|uniref:RNA polymerase sigma factor n=1 Tax=Oligoflexus sp. TaxID=1971216 RepID=UPI002D7E3EF2|nr:RNA polymerase sigma factor [Oligoflexus sp.]HET9239229.1 RNA polymerase sigma factor [Oligoflexus sp.]